MNILDQICADKKAHIERKKQEISLSDLEAKAAQYDSPRGFINMLRQDGIALIAEVKKASPSKGVIREDFAPLAIAKIYEGAGASCLSVLTDEPYFQGKDKYLQDIRTAVDLPLLRKDFMLDPYQIVESYVLGADCVLLIMAALSDNQVHELYQCAKEYDLDSLIEIHNAEELERALKLDPEMIGVNNRDLKTLKVDIQTSLDLAPQIPKNIVKIAESGIETHADIQKLENHGYHAVLVGESLIRQDDIKKAVKILLNKD